MLLRINTWPLPFRWLHGDFLQLDAEAIEGEVEDYGRELYKIQKVFNNRMKKLLVEKEERDRERKKKRRLDDDEEGAKEEDQEEEIKPPAALEICNKTMVKIFLLLIIRYLLPTYSVAKKHILPFSLKGS